MLIPDQIEGFNSKTAETPSISDQSVDVFLILPVGTHTTSRTLVVSVFNTLDQPTIFSAIENRASKSHATTRWQAQMGKLGEAFFLSELSSPDKRRSYDKAYYPQRAIVKEKS